MNKGLGLIAGVAGAALLLAACGGNDDLEPETVTIRGVDFAFESVPDRVAAGSTLVLSNESDVEVHEIVVLRIRDGVELSVEELLQLADEEAEEYLQPGPPAMVLVAAPGETSFAAVGDGTLTEAGRYALLCFIPTGADPEEFMAAAQGGGDGPPDVAGGPPHVVHGMYAELTVE